MRPFIHRLAICFWVLWIALCIPILGAGIYKAIFDGTDLYTHRDYESRPSAPVAIVEEFQKGTLGPENTKVLLRAIRTYELNVPPGYEIPVPKPWDDRLALLGVGLLLAGITGFLLGLFQYLVVGHPNPIRLLRAKIESTE
jgi:hypothetical protein